MGVGLAMISLLIYLMQGVSCGTWNLKLPERVVGISGSCVTVPCRFDVPDNLIQSLVNCSASSVWKKGHIRGPSVLFGSSPNTNSIQGRIVGDLTRKNCTTVLYSFQVNNSDLYFFRLDCSETLKFTFSNGVHISVQPGPSPPSLSSISVLSAGSQVRLQCSLPVPCHFLPPSITWLPRDDSKQERIQIQQSQDGQTILTSTLTFIASADHDKQNVTCSASYPLTNGGSVQPPMTSQKLNVLYAPKATVATVSPSGPVSVGNVVIFTCSSNANPPVSIYTWYSTDNDGNLNKKAEGEVLVLNVCQRDSGMYLCEARSQKGSQKSRPVSLEVNNNIRDCSNSVGVAPYIICGVVLVLYVLTVIVDVYKYQNLTKRLENIDPKGEHTYINLRGSRVSPDYEQVQYRQPKTRSSSDVPNYV